MALDSQKKIMQNLSILALQVLKTGLVGRHPVGKRCKNKCDEVKKKKKKNQKNIGL